MAKKHDMKLMLAEQILEVRYMPSGTFLDVRGYLADYIRQTAFLPHWKIDTNVVSFRDKPESAEREGAFAGYRSAGYFAFDPETRNKFVDRAGAFWRVLQKNKHYVLPDIERFGTRSKVFLPSDMEFEDINRNVYDFFYTEDAKMAVGGTEKDVSFTIELRERDFDVRVTGGPMHKGEARRYVGFDSSHFEKAGFFLDIDFYRTENIKHDDVPRMVHSAIDLMWQKVESLAAAVGV